MSKPIILCVDDERMILNSLKTQLKGAFGNHYIYEVAENGEEALELIEELDDLEELGIILIVSDWLMPGMKGDEFLIKVHEKFPKIVKIMLTGQADINAITRVTENAELYCCLSKPWSEDDLIVTIKSALEKL